MKENGAPHCEKGQNTLCWWGLGFTPSSCWQAVCFKEDSRMEFCFLCLVGGQFGATLPEVQERVCVLG